MIIHLQPYEAPTTDVVEVKAEGTICQLSDVGLQDYTWHNDIPEE